MNVIIIPARLESTRLPNKLMLMKDNVPIIVHTIKAALKSKLADKVVLASGDDEILQATCRIRSSKFVKFKSQLQHSCGTSRVFEAARELNFCRDKESGSIVNWQGDEPGLSPTHIDKLINKVTQGKTVLSKPYSIATLACKATSEEMDDPTKVKVVINQLKEAMYFSRSHVPYGGVGLRHIGVYAFNSKTFAKLSSTSSISYSINSSEVLEQLSWLENGFTTHVVVVNRSPCGIDTVQDYNNFIAGSK